VNGLLNLLVTKIPEKVSHGFTNGKKLKRAA
jgi:hypothetical protein